MRRRRDHCALALPEATQQSARPRRARAHRDQNGAESAFRPIQAATATALIGTDIALGT